MATTIAAFSIAALLLGGDFWVGMLYLMVLIIPLSSAVYMLHRRQRNTRNVGLVEKWSSRLYALQGVALACWAYDLATTYYAIDVARVATEINPLGWPLGALGAFTYYGPTVILTYVLLFKMHQKLSLYAAVPITIVALYMGTMNLNAGINNFGFFIQNATLSAPVRGNLLALVAGTDIVYALVLAWFARLPFPRSNLGRQNPSKTAR